MPVEPQDEAIDRDNLVNENEVSNMAGEQLNAAIHELIDALKEQNTSEQSEVKKINSFKPDKLSPNESDVELWLARFKSWTTISGIANDTEAVYNALKLLVPDADLHWLEGISYTNVDDIYAVLTDHFNNKTPLWLLEQQLWNRMMSSTESLEIYIQDIERMCNKLHKSEKEKMTAFVRGLQPNIRIHLIQHNPQTWEDTLKRARLAQEAKSLDVVQQPGDLQSIVSAQTKCLEELTRAVSALQITKEAAACAMRNDTIQCQLCEKQGHSARDCRSGKSEIKCYYCHKKGHIKRHCRKFQQDNKLNE